VLWFLSLLGAPSDPDANAEWQCRHPGRVSFAVALVLAGFFGAWLMVSTLKPKLAGEFFAVTFLAFWIVFYISGRVRIWRQRHGGPPAVDVQVIRDRRREHA
jgi:hypothetical protein